MLRHFPCCYAYQTGIHTQYIDDISSKITKNPETFAFIRFVSVLHRAHCLFETTRYIWNYSWGNVFLLSTDVYLNTLMDECLCNYWFYDCSVAKVRLFFHLSPRQYRKWVNLEYLNDRMGVPSGCELLQGGCFFFRFEMLHMFLSSLVHGQIVLMSSTTIGFNHLIFPTLEKW